MNYLDSIKLFICQRGKVTYPRSFISNGTERTRTQFFLLQFNALTYPEVIFKRFSNETTGALITQNRHKQSPRLLLYQVLIF